MSNVNNSNGNNKVGLLQKIEQAAPSQLATLPEVADRFKHIYAIMNGGNVQKAEVKYEAEKFHFMKLIQDKPDLQQCTKLSLYGCFLDMAVNGLSFDPSMKHAYVVARDVNVGTKQSPKYEKRAFLEIDGRGELVMRMKQGQIKYADNPVLVYEGDMFRHGTKNGSIFLEHEAVFPRKSETIIACYIRIERPDSSVDYKVLSIGEVNKLKAFSKQPGSKAWTDGLPGMIQTKTIKHAFRSYPKVRMGDFSNLASNTVDADHEEAPPIDYGLNGSTPPPATTLPAEPITPAEVVEPPPPVDDEAFLQKQKPAQSGPRFDDDEF